MGEPFMNDPSLPEARPHRSSAEDHASAALFAGTPYRFLSELGRGESSSVYLVSHRMMGARQVAKVLHPHLARASDGLKRLRREGRILGRLQHPHVVVVDGAGTTSDGRPFLLFQYLKGETLTARLERSRLSPTTSVQIAREVLSALEAAHGVGVLHRHVCPNNLFLEELAEGTFRTRVLDFGWAKLDESRTREGTSSSAALSVSGELWGEAGYRSPETERGAEWEEADDVYSVGALLYRCLSGRSLPAGGRRPTKLRVQEGPSALRALVARALQPERTMRFRSARELQLALRQLGPEVAASADELEPTRALAARQRSTKLVLAVLLFTASLLLGEVAALVFRWVDS